jgi:hypothetical protein
MAQLPYFCGFAYIGESGVTSHAIDHSYSGDYLLLSKLDPIYFTYSIFRGVIVPKQSVSMSSLRPDSPQQTSSREYPPGKGLCISPIRQSQPDPLDAVLRKLNLNRNALTPEACESLRISAPQILDPQTPTRDYLLAKSVRGKLAKSEFLERKFLPRDVLENLMSEKNIQEALEAEAVDYMDHLDLGYIKEHAPKTFAALVYCNLVKETIPLLGCGFRDIYLPIIRKQEHATSLSGIPRDHPALGAFRTWGEQEITEFCEKQWLFMPKTFTKECVMEDLHEDCPLPLLTCTNEGAGGSFSILHKATIHHAHQDITKVSQLEPSVAIHTNVLGQTHCCHQRAEDY